MNYHLIFKYLLFYMFFVSTNLTANVTIKNTSETIENFPMQVYIDSTHKLTIDDISKKDFRKDIPSQFSLGYHDSSLWFKLKLSNQSSKEKFILYFSEVFFETLTLFELKDGHWIKHSNHLLNKLSSDEPNPFFNIHIKHGESKTYYLQASSLFSYYGEFKIYTPKSFFTHKTVTNFFLYFFYFGALIITIFFNLFLFAIHKQKVYLFYALYGLFYTIFIFVFSGIDIYFGLASIHYKLHIVAPLFIYFFVLFSQEYLHIKRYLPNTFLVFRYLKYSLLLLCVLIFFSIAPWYKVMNTIASITFLLLFYSALRISIISNIKLKYYIAGMSIYMITIALMSMMVDGWLANNDISRYSFLFGSFIEMVFFSILLLDNFYEEQKEQLKIQNDLIIIKKKNEEKLKILLAQRTKQIHDLLKEKDLLLKEVFHRVKNNFQIIISLLWFESNRKAQKDNSFLKITNRMKLLSVLHRLLYKSDSLSKIESVQYFTELREILLKEYKNTTTFEQQITSCSLQIKEATYLGLIYNEILNNLVLTKKHNLIDIKLILHKKRLILYIKSQNLVLNEELVFIRKFASYLEKGHIRYCQKSSIFLISFQYSL